MEYFVEQAATHRDAERNVRVKYGERAKIMHYKTVRMGGFLGMFAREGVEVTGYLANEPPRAGAQAKQAVIDDEKKKLLELGGRSDKSLDAVLKEIREIKEKMNGVGLQSDIPVDHPSIGRIRGILEANDFTPTYVTKIVNRLSKEFSLDELGEFDRVQDAVVGWIAESIRVVTPVRRDRPHVYILVGPTGVGKTTTIAKLAAMHGLALKSGRRPEVRILTIDNYRIGARQQIETYAEIMDIPVGFVESFDDMRKYIDMYSDVDLILVDTIGKSPRDFQKLGEMNSLLQACGGAADIHLAMSATTKTSDMYEVLRQFEPFRYSAVVITKLDETSRVGNIISVLDEKQKPVAYMTDGQSVPQGIERASVLKFLLSIEGFKVNRDRYKNDEGWRE